MEKLDNVEDRDEEEAGGEDADQCWALGSRVSSSSWRESLAESRVNKKSGKRSVDSTLLGGSDCPCCASAMEAMTCTVSGCAALLVGGVGGKRSAKSTAYRARGGGVKMRSI